MHTHPIEGLLRLGTTEQFWKNTNSQIDKFRQNSRVQQTDVSEIYDTDTIFVH